VPAAQEHLRAVLLAQRAALLEHESAVRAGNEPDAVRRFRVAGRRMRAFLRAARPLLVVNWSESLRHELGWLGRALGQVRDLDVLLAHVRSVATHFEPGEQFVLARPLRQLDDEREAAQRELLDALDSSRYATLLERLDRELPVMPARQSEVTLQDIAAAEFRRLRKAYRSLGGVATDSELHALRLQVKRARYAMELVESDLGRGATRFIASAKRVQDVLGEHQDASVAEARVRGLLGCPQGNRFAVPAGRLIERQAVRREAARTAFPAAWVALEKHGRSAFAA
jgi:CHAD domain-containing protein